MLSDHVPSSSDRIAEGLRERKKARRRQEILRCAEDLFARDGVEATTVAAIAKQAEISPPTVFNYFGSKENILQALIFEGTARERDNHIKRPRKTGCAFADVMHEFLYEFTVNTLQIAGKRVWRYAESTDIRRPDSEFAKKFAASDRELMKLLATFLGGYDTVLKHGCADNLGLVTRLFFDRWTARYLEFIKDDPMTLKTHSDALRKDVETMVVLLFDDTFAATSPLSSSEAA